MRFLKSVLFFFLAAALASAQNTTESELKQRIERQVRAYTEAPPNAQITLGARSPGNFAGYDNLPVTIEANGIRKTLCELFI